MFLEFPGTAYLAGETQDKDKATKQAIDLLAWSWGMSQSGTFHSGSGGGAGKV
ncbi:MAG: type VI secretion system tube protein Hcp, partial [Janthinobacterium lividum]